MPGTPEAEAGKKAFDAAAIETLDQAEIIKAATEQATIVAMEKGLGVELGEFGKLFNRLTESIEKFTTGTLTDFAIKAGQANIPGVGKSAKDLTQGVMTGNVSVKVEETFLDELEAKLEKGLKEEAFGLIKYKNLTPLKTIGYKELFNHFDGKLSLDDAINEIKKNTRRFAKKQITWFKKYDNAFRFSSSKSASEVFNILNDLN